MENLELPQVNNQEELELILEYSGLEKEDRNKVVESSKAFMDFQKYLTEKYPNVRPEILEKRSQMFTKKCLTENEDLVTRLMNEDFTVFSEIIVTYAESEGYDDSEELAKSFMSILNIFL